MPNINLYGVASTCYSVSDAYKLGKVFRDQTMCYVSVTVGQGSEIDPTWYFEVHYRTVYCSKRTTDDDVSLREYEIENFLTLCKGSHVSPSSCT